MTKVAKNRLYVGLDVHLKSWKVTILTEAFEHKTFSIPADFKILDKYLQTHFQDFDVLCCYEAGFCGFHIYDKIISAGYECLVVNPADVPTSSKEVDQKSDFRDSRKLAHQLRSGNLKGIFIPPHKQRAFREVFRLREKRSRDVRRAKNRIKSFLYKIGIEIPQAYAHKNCYSKAFMNWFFSLQFDEEGIQYTRDEYYEDLEYCRKKLSRVTLQLRQLAKTKHEVELDLLTSIPGIGPVTAYTVLSEVGDITRFDNVDQLASYVGIIPSVSSSGESIKVRGMTNRAKTILRKNIIESAWVAARLEPDLTAYFFKNYDPNNKNKRIIKVARKLLSRMLAIMKNKEPYRKLAKIQVA